MSDGSAQQDEDPQERIAALEAELASVRRAHDHKALELQRTEHEREQYRKLYTLVLYELERLKRQLFGKKAESVDPNQVQLAFEPVLEALARAQTGDASAQQDVQAELDKLRAAAEEARGSEADGCNDNKGNGAGKKRGKGHGRRDFDAEQAPVETIVLEPPERSLPGGELLIKIGEEVSEHFDYRPASIIRVRVVRPKYRKPEPSVGASPIVVAELPERPIARSVAGPGLIAHVITQKYADHAPLHRQQQIFKRQGIHLPRSTLANLVQGGTALLSRIIDAMWQHAREHAAWLAIDATGVLVLAAEQCRRGHFWVVIAQRDHVLFRYTKKHNGSVPADMLAGFSGYVIADASSVYHELYRNEPGIIEVSCWSHARRRFFDALSVDRERALVGIGFIGLLYDAHRAALDPGTGIADTAKRRAAAEPVLNKLYAWIKTERPLLVDESPLTKAMNYLVNHRESLSRFLDDGRLRLDNNISEIELRRQAVGRHNWVFCGSDDGADWNAISTSLIASCQMHGIEPWAYLRDVLTLLPSWPSRDVLQLAPKFWAQTRQQQHTQQRLAAARLLGRFDQTHESQATA